MQKAQKAHAGKAEPTTAQKAKALQQVQRALLKRGQVARLVPYKLAWARGYTARPFQWGYVLGQGGPLTASGTPLLKALGAATGMRLGMAAAARSAGRPGRSGEPGPGQRAALRPGVRHHRPGTDADDPRHAKQLQQAAEDLADPRLRHRRRREGASSARRSAA